MPLFNRKRSTKKRKNRKIQRKTLRGGAGVLARGLASRGALNVAASSAARGALNVGVSSAAKGALNVAASSFGRTAVRAAESALSRGILNAAQNSVVGLAAREARPAFGQVARQAPLSKSAFGLSPKPVLGEMFGRQPPPSMAPGVGQRQMHTRSFAKSNTSNFLIQVIEKMKTGAQLKALLPKDDVIALGIDKAGTSIPLIRWKVTGWLKSKDRLRSPPIEQDIALKEFEIAYLKTLRGQNAATAKAKAESELAALIEANGGQKRSKSTPEFQGRNQGQELVGVEGEAGEGLGEVGVADPPVPREAPAAAPVAVKEEAAAAPVAVKEQAAAAGTNVKKAATAAEKKGRQEAADALENTSAFLQGEALRAAKAANTAAKKADELTKQFERFRLAEEQAKRDAEDLAKLSAQIKTTGGAVTEEATTAAKKAADAAPAGSTKAERALIAFNAEMGPINLATVTGNLGAKNTAEALKPVVTQYFENEVYNSIKTELSDLGNAQLNSAGPVLYENLLGKFGGKGEPILLDKAGLEQARKTVGAGQIRPAIAEENNAMSLMNVVKYWTPYGRKLHKLKEMLKISKNNFNAFKFRQPELVNNIKALEGFKANVYEGLEVILKNSTKEEIMQIITVFTPDRLLNYKAGLLNVFGYDVNAGIKIQHLMMTQVIPGKKFDIASIDALINKMRFDPDFIREEMDVALGLAAKRAEELKISFDMNFEKGKGLFGAKTMYSLLLATGGASVLFIACLNDIPDMQALGIALRNAKDDNKKTIQRIIDDAKSLRDQFILKILGQVPPEPNAVAVAAAAALAAEPKVRTWSDYAMEQIGLNPEVAADRRRFTELADAAKRHAGDVGKAGLVAGVGLAVKAAFGK